jgi:alkanesulfonate monooxygenase SsuD/methylene tetrahydromethanopterin reductase-like flavin-dependent oxidoreductase (luciferase family)
MKTDLLFIPMGAQVGQLRAAAIAAQAAGFDGAWTWDHLRSTGGEGPCPEAMTTLAMFAEAAPKLTVGPLVLNVINRHPAVLANAAATLQEASGGRFILGIGAGGGVRTPYETEQRMAGQEVGRDPRRAGRVIEAIQVIKRLWAGDSSDFEGRYYQLKGPRGFMRPATPPPIVVGAFGPRMADVAGRFGDGLNTQAGHPQLGRMIEIARDAREQSGRDPAELLVTVFTGLGEGWLKPGSRNRQAMEQLGVDRLILLIGPPFDPATIRDAGTLLLGR